MKFIPDQEQLIAAKWELNPSSHLLITAGPGTGKSATLKLRVEYLLDKGIDPYKILIITFTKKATKELQERLKTYNGLNIYTFHSLAARQLHSLGIEITPMSDALLRSLIRDLDYPSLSKKDLALEISRAINLMPDSNQELATIYSSLKQAKDLYDHEDLIKLATENIAKGKISPDYQYILVDEVQDATLLQLEFLKQLITPTTQLMAVGDPRQAIYGFRGSFPEVFTYIEKDFPNISRLELIKNHRSAPEIITAANAIFPQLAPLQASGGKGEVKIIGALSPYTEADYVINDIKKQIGALALEKDTHLPSNLSFKDIAILFRHHSQKEIIVKKLEQEGLPIQLVGDLSPFHDQNLQFLASTLQFLNEPSDENLYPILIHITRGKLTTLSVKDLANVSNPKVKAFSQAFNVLQSEYLKDPQNIKAYISSYLDRLSIKIADVNLAEFWSLYNQFENIPTFLNAITELGNNNYYDEHAAKITLSTIHSSKGLEFKCVYLLDFDKKTMTTEPEEVRLFYVALTRAITRAVLLYVKDRGVSELANPLLSLGITLEDDPDLAKQLKKKEINREKRSQIGLF
jgi:DNA helicase-2/ATP-dependent DNA helicase PcrA